MSLLITMKEEDKMDIRFLCNHSDCVATELESLKKFGYNSPKKGKFRSERQAYFCTMPGCSRNFVKESYLKDHLRLHSGEDPYACSIRGCKRRFKWRSSLSCHKRSHEREGKLEGNITPRREDMQMSTTSSTSAPKLW
eukprot:Plantae.Rhodophyta-Purpureofilum_apyrenoidigerum.ctg1124.p1 GENE.Plantae.Rhodophyta-Purpureofilum_apyrenoidigerum.ctg1124~~Plantae.Rhodophyta-Purpureofilum_apyrenoidigerum.ctg1124.p1  ORF type:complete len:138 (-),score=14.37 Plantae.Rhodophyta-Purpureofilum_apyrenoidigerum.ctg1124:786-1199(-)